MRAGLDRVTVSLDRPPTPIGSSRSPRVPDMVKFWKESQRGGTGSRGVKINTVVIRDFNDDEVIDLVEFGKREESRGSG